nr:hypothetical protein [Actinomadura sp. WMMB 499]
MDPVSRGVGAVRKGDVGVEVVAVPPGCGDPLEERAVVVTPVGQILVQTADVDGVGVVRQFRGRVVRRDGVRGESAGCMPCPGRVVRFPGRAGMDGQRASSVAVGWVEGDLDVDAGLVGEEERRFEGEVFDMGSAGVCAGVECEVHQGGAGDEHGSVDGVVGQPWVGAG